MSAVSVRKRFGSPVRMFGRSLTACAAVLACAVAPASADAKTAVTHPANPALIRALNNLATVTPPPGSWPLYAPSIPGTGSAYYDWQQLVANAKLMNSQWDSIRELTSYARVLAGESANKQDVDAQTASAYAALRQFFGATTVKDCSTKSLASVCLRQSVADMRSNEQHIASETNRFLTLMQAYFDATTPPGLTPPNAVSANGYNLGVVLPKLRKVALAIKAVAALV
jgi:hypothetical protein